MKYKSGIIHFLPLLLITGLIIAVIGGIFYFNQSSEQPPITQTSPLPEYEEIVVNDVEWLVFENNKYRFEYPSDWFIQDGDSVVLTNFDIESVHFEDPKMFYSDKNKAKIEMIFLAQEYDGALDFAEWIKQNYFAESEKLNVEKGIIRFRGGYDIYIIENTSSNLNEEITALVKGNEVFMYSVINPNKITKRILSTFEFTK